MTADRFIPYTRQDIISMCLKQDSTNIDSESFNQICSLLSSLLHFEYHHLLEELKEAYTPFNPNLDTKQLSAISKDDLKQCQQKFGESFTKLLNAANFEKITEQDIQDALLEESLFNVRLEVEFDDFEQVVFYRRGESQKTETISSLWGLKKEEITFTNFDRVAVFIKFKDQAYFDSKKKKPLGFEPGSTIIKLFQNVPKADLEMLFPNSEIRMRTIDKAIIGGSALVGGIAVLVTKLAPSLVLLATLFAFWLGMREQSVEIGEQQLIALFAGLGVFGSFVFKEFNKFKNRKIKFMKALADNLYYKNLDNNAGVFHTLIDAAEEEDFKEVILAYFFLLQSPDGLKRLELDQKIEAWFEKKYQFKLDFEISDALRKLKKLKLVKTNQNKYTAIPLKKAKIILTQEWDQIF